jgi:N-acetylmuramoyl-L-alanine amidase
MAKLKSIFVHCSASPWGDALIFDEWHKKRGWKGIGYHYVILNGRPYADVTYWDFLDGQIEPGRHLNDDPIFSADEIGAHVAGRNPDSIGICLVGRDKFTNDQLETARDLLSELIQHFDLTVSDVLGHYEDPHTEKTCPNIPCSALRDYLSGIIQLDALQECIKDQATLHWVNLADKSEVDWYKAWKLQKKL